MSVVDLAVFYSTLSRLGPRGWYLLEIADKLEQQKVYPIYGGVFGCLAILLVFELWFGLKGEKSFLFVIFAVGVGVLLSVLLELYFRPRRKRLLDRLLSEFDPSDLSNAGIYSA